jgi:ribulose-phosphate 3-epimerase
MKIYPSIMAKSQQEMNLMFKKLVGVAKEVHLDVADGKFVPNKYNWFNFKLSKKFKYNAHLMVKNPVSWIKKKGSRVDTIIFHPEAVKDVDKVIDLIKKKKKKVGLALKPETKVSSIKEYLDKLDYVLVLTVHPGFYGAKYLKSPLKKIKQIKKLNSKVKVIVDGGMKLQTVKDAVKAGADCIVSGSFVTRADDSKKAIRELRSAIRK